MPGDAILVAESLARGFGEGEARLELFSGLSLTLEAGEAVAIVGPSGCGKSTLLHLLAGLDRPDAGRVAVDGRDWETLAPEPKAKWRGEAVGFVFQLHHLLPELTAEENVALPLFLAGIGDAAARAAARELLARVGLVRQAGSLPRVLSGGERQRVAIARAVVRRPRLLLCDEPPSIWLTSKTYEGATYERNEGLYFDKNRLFTWQGVKPFPGVRTPSDGQDPKDPMGRKPKDAAAADDAPGEPSP